MRNKGIIFRLEDGRYGLAPYHLQHPHFEKLKKVAVKVFADQECTQECREQGNANQINLLVSKAKLIQVGFID